MSDMDLITVRTACASDLPALVVLLEEIMAHHAFSPPPPDALTSILNRILNSPDHVFLVAASPEEVVGACSLIFTLSTWSAALVCEVQDVVVAARCRAAGVGRALLASAEREARDRGCARLFLSAESENLGGHAFYRSLGLRERAVLHFERDLTAVERDLTAVDHDPSSSSTRRS